MLMKTRLPIVLGAAALAFLPTESPACTRAVYLGPEGMTVTGRTMDWREDPLTNLYIFPRGTARRGANTDNTVFWTSKYGTLSAAGYDIGITDGMNEAGWSPTCCSCPNPSTNARRYAPGHGTEHLDAVCAG